MNTLKLPGLSGTTSKFNGRQLAGLVLMILMPIQWAFAGDLRGVVSDPTLDRFVDGALVSMGARKTQTDRTGRYVFRDVQAGDYTVQVSAGGYDVQSQSVTVPATGEAGLQRGRSGAAPSRPVGGNRPGRRAIPRDPRHRFEPE